MALNTPIPHWLSLPLAEALAWEAVAGKVTAELIAAMKERGDG